MLPLAIVCGLVIGFVIVALIYRGAGALVEHTWGRVVLLVGLIALPVGLSVGNMAYGVHESSRTHFCVSCHEMEPYGRSLFVDNKQALPATHYQNRLIDRDATCYSCHKDYALFGDLKAKLNGLRHVWVHYLRPIPTKIALYQPYPNSNCLHCHEDARRFLEGAAHKPILDDLYRSKTSCLGCHNVGHDLKSVESGKLWEAQ